MKLFAIIVFVLFATEGYSQPDKNGNIVCPVYPMPEFPGGQDSLFKFMGRNLHYPQLAQDCNCQGTVYITFVVNEQGSITEAKVLKGVKCKAPLITTTVGGQKTEVPDKGCADCGELLDKEALRVVNSMPNWKPAIVDGKPEKVQYNLPIKFTLR